MKILPFRSIFIDLRDNFWHLRSFFILLFLIILFDGLLLFGFDQVTADEVHQRGLCFWINLAFDDVFPPSLMEEPASAGFVNVIRKINGLLGYVLLGLIFHVIRESFRDQRLHKSRAIFFATDEEAR